MKKVLILGANGFIGREIIGLASSDWKITGTYHKNKEKIPRDISLVRADLTKESEVKSIFDEKYDLCYHCAATTPFSTKGYNGIPDIIMALNIGKAINCEKLIFPSSYIVYGSALNFPISENTVTSPNTLYGISKLSSELYLKHFLQIKSIPYVFLRASCVIGPGQSHGVFFNFIDSNRDGKELIVEDKCAKRDYVDSIDFTKAMIAASDKGEGIYNIGSGKSYSVEELAKEVISLAGKGMISYGSKKSEMANNELDISKAKKELSYKPVISLPQSLKRIMDNRI